MKIPPVVKDSLCKIAGAPFGTKTWRNLMSKPGDHLPILILLSTTTKDIVNCGYYTYQSYNNERIPVEKRKFVSFMDLANGIINVTLGTWLGLKVGDNSDRIYDKIFKNKYGDSRIKQLCEKYGINRDINKLGEKAVKDGLKDVRKAARTGFGALAVLVVSQIISKRIFTPLIATPIAGEMNRFADKYEAKKKGLKPDENGEFPKSGGTILEYMSTPATQVSKAFEKFYTKN